MGIGLMEKLMGFGFFFYIYQHMSSSWVGLLVEILERMGEINQKPRSLFMIHKTGLILSAHSAIISQLSTVEKDHSLQREEDRTSLIKTRAVEEQLGLQTLYQHRGT